MTSQEVRVADSVDVVQGQMLDIRVSGARILLTRVDGVVQAVINKCSHLGMPMHKGKLENGIVQCPFHGSRFDLCTGKNVDWVNSVMGIPAPRWSHKLISMGKSPAALTKLVARESEGGVFVSLDN